MKDQKQILIRLFVSTLYLSAFTFGGGYVIVTLLKKKFVDEYHWIEEDEMLDLVAIAQSAPGAIAVNGAIVVGYQLAGMVGALVAIVATILPPFVIISVISVFYAAFRDNFLVSQMLEGMQAGVGAVIASVVWEMGSDVVKSKRSSFLKESSQRHAALIGRAGQSGDSALPINVILVDLSYLLSTWHTSPTSLRQEILEVLS